MTATLIALLLLFLFLFLGLPIGIGMGVVGVAGFAWLIGFWPAMHMLGQTSYDTVVNYNLSVLPLFILMGHLVSQAGLSQKLFEAANAWVGHVKGGLAVASVMACGGFSAVCGSSMATAATMGRVVIPTMRSYGYDAGIAAGAVAAGGTLGILIPPSVLLVVYGILTEQNIGALFAAGILPGILGIILYSAAVMVVAHFAPRKAPSGPRSNWSHRISALKGIAGVAILFLVIMGGIYGGVFTPTEAAGIGAVGAFLMALLSGNLTWKIFNEALVDTVLTTSMMFILVIGAITFTNFINVAGFPQAINAFLAEYRPSPMTVILALVMVYLVLGCFLESLSMILLTVPVFYPVVAGLGFDLVWFGIFIVILVEISLITPPVGLNIFVLHSAFPDIKLSTIFRGVLPFVAADVVRLALVIFIPGIATLLPRLFF
ncbi:TRAP transporter large permease [Hoeflea alexandrii]|uniref:TRAP transporter large permease n=1 Tax=Hoeflea alexandrii TaxID=288436 RepID=UPI0022B05444|nr:TRAP transporter large permease [Hoeflea alexandrii]MCZ4290985.1 TRAP transporter large permease [Hoeflea alexandrii]